MRFDEMAAPKERDPSRPGCAVLGCNNNAVSIGKGRFAKECQRHLEAKRAATKGMTPEQYRNSFHPHRKHRGTNCANVDGQLGFKCTTNIADSCMLDVDHIDGNPSNNKPSNLQTLCKCCHSFKTKTSKDGISLGRKTLNIKY